MLVRQQIAGIAAQAEKLEHEADALDAERDVLERERDATKAALAKASLRSGFAVLPYKGANGTWRRPIVIECTRGGAKLQPHGPSFTTLELSPRIRPSSSAFIKAIARDLLRVRSAETPDGTPAIPYIVFLVRPDGVGPYYLARTCLEPLGMAFGYELVEQGLKINVPDFDDLTTWDGTIPLDMPLEPAPRAGLSSGRVAQGNQQNDPQRRRASGRPGLDDRRTRRQRSRKRTRRAGKRILRRPRARRLRMARTRARSRPRRAALLDTLQRWRARRPVGRGRFGYQPDRGHRQRRGCRNKCRCRRGCRRRWRRARRCSHRARPSGRVGSRSQR